MLSTPHPPSQPNSMMHMMGRQPLPKYLPAITSASPQLVDKNPESSSGFYSIMSQSAVSQNNYNMHSNQSRPHSIVDTDTGRGSGMSVHQHLISANDLMPPPAAPPPLSHLSHHPMSSNHSHRKPSLSSHNIPITIQNHNFHDNAAMDTAKSYYDVSHMAPHPPSAPRPMSQQSLQDKQTPGILLL